MTARLDASDLVVVRQARRILDGASLAVGKGAIVAIEGPSGSGKSTLLKAMATLTPIDGGELRLEGTPADQIAATEYRRRVAYVSQQPPMLEGSVAVNVAAGPALRGHRVAPAEVAALLERVGLSGSFAERDARDLSGGERQRVALARALANEPIVLLLDEPTGALDPDAATRVLDLVVTLAADGLSVVVVTHVVAHAAHLGGARFACREGRIQPLASAP